MATKIQVDAFKVNTAQMTATAEELLKKGNKLQRHFNEIAAVIAGTKNYWLGDAADKHRKLYREQENEVNQMLQRILEHPAKLGLISDNYDKVEKKSISRTEVLRAGID